jgi:ADP-ribose pyrophosphatase YjhB (NUDIX family)
MSMQPPRFHRAVPEGDSRERDVCSQCGFIHYENPRLIVGTLATWQGKILLCRRAIEPRAGYWTLPAGFLEQGETARAGAERETLEESGAKVRATRLLALYDLPHIAQVHLFYLATMESGLLRPGDESLSAELVAPAAIPWQELAFPTIEWALRDWLTLAPGQRDFAVFEAEPGRRWSGSWRGSRA